MSRASKVTLGLTSAFAFGIVLFVHYGQHAEKSVMHAGVIRDLEQQRIREERRLDFETQQALEKEYKLVQTVRDTTHLTPPPQS